MTTVVPPLVDPRTRDVVEHQVRRELARNVPAWPEHAPQTGAAAALLRVFARYVEIVLERVNRVPDRQFLVFLQHLGVAPRPAQPARVPVTFFLSTGARSDAIVPAGCQVSTAAEPGQPPVVFETTRQLTVTATKLAHVFATDPETGRYADFTDLLTHVDDTVSPSQVSDRAIEHLAFIGHPDFFGARPFDELAVYCEIDEAAVIGATSQVVAWSLWDGNAALPLETSEDTTAGLTRSGVVRFQHLPTLARAVVAGVESRWVRAELRSQITAATAVRSITMERAITREGVRPDAAFANAIPIDLTKDFLPLGERPRVGDVFAVASAEAFSLPDAMVKLAITPTTDISLSHAAGDLASPATLLWECWDGEVWQPIGTGRTTEDVQNDVTGFSDTTRALTRTGAVRFRVPKAPRESTVAGIVNHWVRARLIAGGYGEEARYLPPAESAAPAAFAYKPSTLVPPSIKSIAISYSLAGAATTTRPEAILAYNDFEWQVGTALVRQQSATFDLFRPTRDRRKAIYFGLEPPESAAAPSPTTPLSLYVALDERAVQFSTGYVEPGSPLLEWEYPTSADTWKRLVTTDSTRSLTRSGTIEILPPKDIVRSQQFGHQAFWVRVSRRGYAQDRVLPVRRLLLNTVEAVQTISARGEVIGSSNGTAGQVFRASRSGILDDPHLEVNESVSGAGEAASRWITWTELTDFHTSTSADRHFVMDHFTGEVQFGDGVHGLIPPIGLSNVRLAYRTGGGARGNVAAHTIVQLKTAIPYIERVTNTEAATGGGDAETLDAFRRRAPTVLRHHHQAVTADDYEDLAQLASPEVARVKCVPLGDLNAPHARPGTVSVIVVPRSVEPQPLPSVELLDRVHSYLAARQSPSVTLVVRGPTYVAVDVDAEIVVKSLDVVSDIDVAIRRTLDRFLHPLQGGPAGRGWDFGRRPHRSDLFSLMAAVDGVDHVRSIRIGLQHDQSAGADTTRSLISRGVVTTAFSTE